MPNKKTKADLKVLKVLEGGEGGKERISSPRLAKQSHVCRKLPRCLFPGLYHTYVVHR